MFQNAITPAELLTQNESAESGVSKKAMFMVGLILTAIAVLFATAAEAANVNADNFGADIEEVEDIWDFLVGLVSGMGGKILALLALVASFWQVFEQNWRAAGGAGMVCIALAFGPNIIEGLFSAAIPLV